MPIYEYRCGACGHELEVLQKLSEPPLSDCPECHKPSLSKLISPVGFQLKGSGWYATDFKSSGKPAEKSNGKSGEAAKPADAKGESSGGAKSDASDGAKSESSGESKAIAKADTSSTSGGSCGGGCSCH
jgi:putative FmdB family regulatory protein